MISIYKKGFGLIVFYFRKEIRAIFRDKGALLIFVIAMIIYPVIYSIGYQKEVLRDIPVAVVDLDNSNSSRLYARMADATEQVNVKIKPPSLREAEKMFYDGDIKGIFLIPEGFESDIMHGTQTTVSVYCDASYFLMYRQVLTAGTFTTGTFSAGIEIKKLLTKGKTVDQAMKIRDPLPTKTTILYNPSTSYGSYIMPGIIIVILQQTLLVGIGMLGGSKRENKRYRFLLNRVSRRAHAIPIVLGNGAAYMLIYMFNALFCTVLLHNYFQFPDKGQYITVMLLMIPFLLSVVFMSIAFSILFKKREHSMIFMVFLSPIIFFLSGASWPSTSIPQVLHYASYLFPSTTMVSAYLRVRTMGVGISDVSNEFLFLIGQSIFYFALACSFYYLLITRSKDKQPIGK